MKKFLFRLLLFAIIIISLYTFWIATISHIFNKNSLYKIPSNKSVLIIGASHTTVSINDSILDYVYNLSQYGDAFEYSFVKLRKFLPLNPNIRVVLMACNEREISQAAENDQINVCIDEKVRRYFYLMNPSEIIHALEKKPVDVMKTLVVIPKAHIPECIKILKSQFSLKDMYLGGYEGLDSTIKISEELKKQLKNHDNESIVSERNIIYLHKIVSFCRAHNAQIIFIRTPEHRLLSRKNEKIFMGLLHDQFADVVFKDYVNMNLPDSCFFDFDHLSHYGAKIFTDSIGSYLNTLNVSICH